MHFLGAHDVLTYDTPNGSANIDFEYGIQSTNVLSIIEFLRVFDRQSVFPGYATHLCPAILLTVHAVIYII